MVHRRCFVHNHLWFFLLANRTVLVLNRLGLLIFRSHLSIILNVGCRVLPKNLVHVLLVDSPGRSLGNIFQRYLRHVKIKVKSFDLTKAFIKAIRVPIAKLLKEAIRVSKLRLPISFSMMNFLP